MDLATKLPLHVIHEYVIPHIRMEMRAIVVRGIPAYSNYLVNNPGLWMETFGEKLDEVSACKRGILQAVKKFEKKISDRTQSTKETSIIILSTITCDDLISLAVGSGCMDTIKYVWTCVPIKPKITDRYILTPAISNGHTEIVKWLIEMGYIHAEVCAVEDAAAAGYVDVIDLIFKPPHPIQIHISWYTDNILLSKRQILESQILNNAVICGRLECVKTILTHLGYNLEIMRFAQFAAKLGYLDILKLLHSRSNYKRVNEPIFSEVIDNNQRYNIHELLYDAAEGGHINVVKWLLQQSEHGNIHIAAAYARLHGHFELEKWLRDV